MGGAVATALAGGAKEGGSASFWRVPPSSLPSSSLSSSFWRAGRRERKRSGRR
ncbi:hypothetical protein DAI22_02g212950 [Oryza sativa Japonica Group]|nr:hypothetical protein DAI22_02g212950 [Oryza sativa Japonica Group]